MEDLLLPPRMFAAVEEPLGERVNSYHKLKRTELLIDALEPEELEFLRNSTFGKILAIEENPPFSGLVHLCGNPVRMSLREFAIVTRLNCQKIPEPTKKRKNPLKEKLYWNELLGSLKFCTVDTAIDMLKKKASVAIRGYVDAIQLVLLAAIPQLKEEITQSERTVIVDSESESENPNEELALEDDNAVPHDKPSEVTKYCLIPGHAKSIDIECQVPVKSILDEPYEEWSAGLDFSWVDESEDLAVENMLVDKSKSPASDLHDEISSLEKRIYQALDAKLEKIASSTIQSQQLAILQTTIARCLQDIDKKIGAALVGQLKIMQAAILTKTQPPPVNGNLPAVPDISTPSEAADFRINEVLRDLNIVPDHFLPPNTDVDLPRKTPERGGSYADDNLDAELDTANGSSIQISIGADSQLPVEQREVQVEDLVPANNITEQENNQSLGVSTMVVEKPVSQEFEMEEEDAPGVEESPNPTNYISPPKAHEEEASEPRKSKRSWIIPAGLQDYKCDAKVKAGLCIIPDVDHRFMLMEQKLPNGYSMPSLEFCDIAYRTTILPTGVIDTLIGFVSRGPMVGPNVAIYDTTLPVTLMNHNNRFVKTAVKDRSKLKFVDVPLEKHLEKSHERIYFPFNMDKQHWVGVCIDTKVCTLHVLDCNTSFRSDNSLKKELNPIATLLPYVLKQFGFLGTNAGVKAFTVSRCKGIQQVSSQTDSGVMTVLLIDAHAGDGLGAYKAITPRLLPDASKQLAVKFFDDISM
ncbi:uncharacterized protein LOC111206910 [Brassica napus]|uniref:uncharacterized protein LOC111206910 n=1 Tax=Brassica napus TaxID=3708 RepID=UPI00207957B0|nr:uncharacterized protein LOC111206910 [Brassica napus]